MNSYGPCLLNLNIVKVTMSLRAYNTTLVVIFLHLPPYF
jgi:hypothetical protein